MSNNLSIFTTMTNPEERGDPWKEALDCYNSLADEVVVVGEEWPYEFKFDHIGKTFQEGFNKASGDWVIRMDLDYFFHENDFVKLKQILKKKHTIPIYSISSISVFYSGPFSS